MHPQQPAISLGEHPEVATGLRGLHDPEGEAVARHHQILRIITCDLKEYAGVGATLVGLSRRVEKAWTEAYAGGDAPRVSHRAPNRLQLAVMPLVALDEGQEREVVAPLEALEMCSQVPVQRLVGACCLLERDVVSLVGEERQRAV